jgi:hypothetical protein
MPWLALTETTQRESMLIETPVLGLRTRLECLCLMGRSPRPAPDMKPQLNDVEAERMLEGGEYIWSDWHKGYVRARRKGQSLGRLPEKRA